MKSLIFALGLSIAATPAFANLTYFVDLNYPGIDIYGTLTTDGNHGVLSTADIVSSNLILLIRSDPAPFFLQGGTIFSVTGSDLTAGANDLTFDFGPMMAAYSA
jgi:hypothetical protein